MDWFRSYLTNRDQYVCVNNLNSNPKMIQCGVPHGSMLGTLLFLIFINDITKCMNQYKCILYAHFQLVFQVIIMDSAKL